MYSVCFHYNWHQLDVTAKNLWHYILMMTFAQLGRTYGKPFLRRIFMKLGTEAISIVALSRGHFPGINA
jgi:hypothetical protein